MKTLKTKPTDDGFRMPAEFEEHSCCILLWPERRDVWRDGARPVQMAMVSLIDAISRYERVIVGATQKQFMNAKSLLPPHIGVLEVSYDDVWIRDTGPTFITNGEVVRGVDWTFNAWGGVNDGSYFPWDLDELLPLKLLEWFGFDRYKVGLTLEGGAIHVDGEGTLVATKECLLNTNRNPNLSQVMVEDVLSSALGVTSFIWLNRGLYLEENNGHIDNMCSFVRPGEVLLAWTDDKDDPQHAISEEAYDILSSAVDARGRKLVIHRVPLPKPMFITAHEAQGIESSPFALPRLEGDRLPASYVNSYLANGAVIVPSFQCDEDDLVAALFREIYPDRELVQVNGREFLIGGGGIHCLTGHVPKAAEPLAAETDGVQPAA